MNVIVTTRASLQRYVRRLARICRLRTKRKCYLHIGTHKTGTTSLQLALSASRPRLAQRGYLYPMTGIPQGLMGHHALAWELSGDARSEPGGKMAASVLEEISGTRHDVILSSEDLECAAYERVPEFSAFLRSLELAGFEVIVVMYLRNQMEYVRSLYVEMLKHGYPETFASFLNEGLEHGVIRWNKRCAPLCYADLLSRTRECHGGRIVVRSYDDAKHSVVDDFCSVLGETPEVLGMNAGIRANTEISIEESFRLFCINRQGKVPHAGIATLVEREGGFANQVEIGLSERSRNRIAARFCEANQSVLSAYGLRDFSMPVRRAETVRRARLLSFSELFSAEFAEAATGSPDRLAA